MSKRGTYRRHSAEFKMQICQEIREGELTRTDAKEKYRISTALIHTWLMLYDRGELVADPVVIPAQFAEYEAKIAALERKVGQLTMELDQAKKTQHIRLVSNSETPPIVSGPHVAPSVGGVK